MAAVQRSRLGDRVYEALSLVPDPEIPCVSVVDLGIVRGLRDEGTLLITPTYTGCPVTIAIQKAIRVALDQAGLTDMQIEIVLNPPWTTDWITDNGRAKLKAYGIAPPKRGSRKASFYSPQCPRCGSFKTAEVSRVGSTPCKSLWRCGACSEPFDHFKCH